MVHSLADSALLFSASKSRNCRGPRKSGSAISYGILRARTPHIRANGGRTLVVMAKAPRPGMVKTRLAPSLPVEAVTELYRCLLDDTLALAHSLGNVEVAIMCPASDVEELTQLVRKWSGVVAPERPRSCGGPQLSVCALRSAWPADASLPSTATARICRLRFLKTRSRRSLTHDVVVGPTHDGGYYLVGAKASHPALFEGDGMGTNSALEALLARARALQLSVGFTDPFYDIDVAGDLTRLAAELRARSRPSATNGGLVEAVGDRRWHSCGQARKTCEAHAIAAGCTCSASSYLWR